VDFQFALWKIMLLRNQQYADLLLVLRTLTDVHAHTTLWLTETESYTIAVMHPPGAEAVDMIPLAIPVTTLEE